MIDKLVHFSDLHIRLFKDHELYKSIMINMFKQWGIPVTLGCCAYVLVLNFVPQYAIEGSVLCMLGIFGLRAAAIYWDLRVPKMFITKTR